MSSGPTTQKPKRRWRNIAFAATATLVVLAWIGWRVVDASSGDDFNFDLESDSNTIWDMSDSDACDALADEAVRISEGETIELIKVRSAHVVTDSRRSFIRPSGSHSATLLVCRGGGVWSTGADDVDVRIELTIDADDDMFVAYKPVA